MDARFLLISALCFVLSASAQVNDTRVSGPASSTNNNLIAFSGTDGKTAQDSGVAGNGSGGITVQSVIANAATASRAAIIGADKSVTNSAVTATELGFLSGVTSGIQAQIKGYTLTMAQAVGASPSDGATAFFGGDFSFGGAADADVKVVIPKTGTIKSCFVRMACTTGTSETSSSTVNIRLNNTTDTATWSSVAYNTSPQVNNNTGLSIAVTAGDFISMKVVYPTWATNPTNVRWYAVVYIE